MIIELEYGGRSWEIERDRFAYVPRKTYQSENKHGDMVDRVTELGYFTSLEGAIKKIIEEHFGTTEERVTLAEFIDRYNKAVEEIKSIAEPKQEEEF